MNAYSSNSARHPHVTFLGAARCVTGSMHLVETGPHRLLLDCGLNRGSGDERRRNRHFPFDPRTIDAVVLSHAHVDHCGNLPNLIRQGFAGPIYCTPATRDLIGVMLHDSARIQEEDARVAGMVGGRGIAERRPLYLREHVYQTIERCVPVEYGVPHALNPDVQLELLDAGHILGSAVVSLRLAHGGREFRLTFTGDLGRRGLPFLNDPPAIPAADLLICESTYGGRVHDSLPVMAERMGAIVRRTAERGGKVLIPAFSLGRTQVVLHYLHRWMAEGTLPRLPIYVDSPLAAEIGMVYEEHATGLHPGAMAPPAEFLLSREEAWFRTTESGPSIIVASGGMCDGGRIVQHLKHHIDDPRATLVMVSYQAPHSLGHQLLQRTPTVRFHGRTWNKWLDVVDLNGFSGHADREDFRALLGAAVGKTGSVRLVHGDPEQAEALAGQLRTMGFPDVDVPGLEEAIGLR
ncbi:MAG: MBL fold metallo-hydrolase [Gemmataceae bacterium]